MSLTQTAQRQATPAEQAAKPTGYRLFDIQLKRRVALSPSLTRFTFTGPDVEHMTTLAADQRIKLLFPTPQGEPPSLSTNAGWLQAWRTIPLEQRPPMRTYTIRALRAMQREVDVEFVLHGETGPASRWATHARPGDRLQMVAPNAAYPDDPGGYEWQPPLQPDHILLIGDETALPAIAGALETLKAQGSQARIEAFIEVPVHGDRAELAAPAQSRLHWLIREEQGLGHGDGMLSAAKTLATLPTHTEPVGVAEPLADIDIDKQILWELAVPANSAFYAWVAGESAAVMAIRRHWVGELGIDRSACSFMGYWRMGRVLD